jgi:hypothetical protein
MRPEPVEGLGRAQLDGVAAQRYRSERLRVEIPQFRLLKTV